MSMKENMKSLDLLPLETKIATVLPQDFTLESTIIFHGSQIFWWNQVSNSILNSDFEKYIYNWLEIKAYQSQREYKPVFR